MAAEPRYIHLSESQMIKEFSKHEVYWSYYPAQILILFAATRSGKITLTNLQKLASDSSPENAVANETMTLSTALTILKCSDYTATAELVQNMLDYRSRVPVPSIHGVLPGGMSGIPSNDPNSPYFKRWHR